jgi:anti-sigma28 factor (negative regulator of flagellin synthesis)
MSKSKKGKKQDKTPEAQISNPPKQSERRKFLRGMGVMGAGAVIAATGLSSRAKAQTDDKVTVDVPLDQEKIKAIQACLAKGTLKISMSKAAAVSADAPTTDPWLYD